MFSTGILPIGRLEHLVRAATDSKNAMEHWENYLHACRFAFPDEGEFRLFPLVEHNLGCSATEAKGQRWFQEARESTVTHSKNLKASQRKLEEELDLHGVSLIWTKGTALANTIYPEHHLRPSSDLDALCQWDDLDNIFNFARANGWESKLGEREYDNNRRYSGSEMSWIMPDDVVLDVGWMPRVSFAFDPYMMNWLKQQAGGTPVSYANPTWLLIEAIEHGLSANVVSPIRWVVDAIWIIQTNEGEIEWEFILEITQRYRLNTIMYLGISTVAQFTDKIPQHVIDQLLIGANSSILKDELYARVGHTNLAVNYHVTRRYNLALRAPSRIYLKNVVTPLGTEAKQSINLRCRLAARNIYVRLVWSWMQFLVK